MISLKMTKINLMIAVIIGFWYRHDKVYEKTLVTDAINGFIIEIERFVKNKSEDTPNSALHAN